jgi:hypothetical protein
MFGDFLSNFGLNFPVDVNGGLFPQAPTAAAPPQSGVGTPGATGTSTPAPTGSPAAGVGQAGAATTSPSPLASPLSPGQTAPVAGQGSPFGKV